MHDQGRSRQLQKPRWLRLLGQGRTQPVMQWIVLGSGTSVPDPDRGCASHALRGPESVALFDCGSGVRERLARERIAPNDLTHIVCTHGHLDHWGDLLTILFHRANVSPSERRPGLVVAGPASFVAMVPRVLAEISPKLLENNKDVRWVSLQPGEPLDGGWFRVRAYPVVHGSQSAFALRVQPEHRRWTLAYSGDASPCDGLDQAAQGVDCLVCECAMPDGEGGAWHMTPRTVRALVDRAKPRKVVLTHLYPQVLAQGLPGEAFVGCRAEVLVAHDGLRVALG